MSGAPCSQLSAGMRCSSNAMLSSSERAASHHGDQRGAQPWRVLLQPCVLPHAFKSRMPARHRGACALAAAHVPALSYSALDRRRRGCFLPQPAPLRGCRHKPSQRSAVVCQSAGGSQAVGPGAGGGASITTTHWSKQVLDFVQAQFLPLGLVVGILCGYCWPHYGTIAASQSLHRFATIGIFTISGLCLRPAQIQQTMHEWRAILYSCASIWFLTPWVALLVLQLPLVPREFPLGGGRKRAGGSGRNPAEQPGWHPHDAVHDCTHGGRRPGRARQPYTSPAAAAAVCAPAVGGCHGVGRWVDQQRKALAYVNSLLLISVPWMQISASSEVVASVKPAALLAIALVGTLMHVLFLVGNSAAARALRLGAHSSNVAPFPPKQAVEIQGVGTKSPEAVTAVQRAVMLVASQKTLPVSVAVIQGLQGSLGDPGLLVLACIVAHLAQVIFDSALVSFWLKSDAKSKLS
eukprot:jgi/Mesvir1/555/Mv11407-RA.1